MDYDNFVAGKRRAEVPTGHTPGNLNENLFDFQHAIVSWAVRRGRAAIFADTGLGKLKPGSAIVCEPSEVNTLASALRKGIETKRYAAPIGCKVISRRCCPDGNGRV